MNLNGKSVLRITLGCVLCWFGINQLIDPQQWIAWVPMWIPFAKTAVLTNGVVDTLLGVLLLSGKWAKIIAFLAFLHMLGIAISVGYNDIGIRDAGLAFSALALALMSKKKD